MQKGDICDVPRAHPGTDRPDAAVGRFSPDRPRPDRPNVTDVTARLPGDRHGSSMSGNVINLRTARMVRREVEAANDERTDLGPSVDLAVWLHDIVIDGLRSGQFSGHEHGPAAALADLLARIQGGDLLEIAQWHFERVYGSDPYAFVSRLTATMQGRDRKS